MISTASVNLPLPILLHALGCCFLGIKLTFANPTTSRNNSSIRDRTVLGIATTAIGLAYLSTSYMPLEKNAFLYASAPIRIILAGLAGLRLLVDRYLRTQNGQANVDRGSQVASDLFGIMIYDGLGGFVLGLWLGTFSGRIPEYQN